MSKGDIINLVSNLVVEIQREKKDRYDTCGCASCKLRAKDIETWLNADKSVSVPDDIYDETPEAYHQDQIVDTVSTYRVWFCHVCLRKTTELSGRCKFCGEIRL